MGYVSGGATRLTKRLDSITSSIDHDYNGSHEQARHYALMYSQVSGSTILTVIQEYSDSGRQVCAAATTFTWSQSSTATRGFFETNSVGYLKAA